MTSKTTIALENFGIKKLTQAFWKQFLSAVLAGVLVGMAFTATLVVICNSRVGEATEAEKILCKVIGALLFSFALIGCCVFGASFFTGNCAGFISCMHRRVKWKYFAYDLLITWVGNYIGCALSALMIAALPIFYATGQDAHTFDASALTQNLVIFCVDKVTEPWWQTLIAAIFCNILVLGSVMCWVILDNKAAAMLLICLFITGFVLSGYQHVVANMFVTTLGGFVSLFAHWGDATAVIPWCGLMGDHAGQLFYNCIIPSTIGNVIGGVFLISMYYLVNVHVFKHSRLDPVQRGSVNEKTVDFFTQQQQKHMELNSKIDDLDQQYLKASGKIKKELKKYKRELKHLFKDEQPDTKQINVLQQKIKVAEKDLETQKKLYRTEYDKIIQNSKIKK